MINIKKATTSLLIALALILILASPVSAGLRVGGAKIQDSVSPGESVTYTMNVADNSSEPMDITVEVRGLGNYISGPIQALTAENDLSPYSARPFTTATPATFHLEPGQSQDVTVTLNVPANVGDGGRYADIFIYTLPSGGGQIAVSAAVSAQVLLTIEGSTPTISGDITSIDIPQAVSEQLLSATAVIKNTGNYHYKLVCNGTVKNSLGQVVGVSWPTDSVYNLIPTFSRQIAVPLNMSQELTPGTYNLSIDAYTQDGVWLDTDYKTFNITESYKPMPLNPLAIEFFEEGKLSVYQWVMAKDGTLMEKVEAASLTSDVSIDILQGTKVTGENGEPPAPITVTALDTPPSLPTGYETISAFEFSSEGVTFDPKADITLQYSSADIPEGVSETQLGIRTFNEDTERWSPVDSEIDTDANTITFPVTHFSIYAIFAPASAKPTTIWIWIGVGALWVVVIAASIIIMQRRRTATAQAHKNRGRRTPRAQGPRDNW
jgi:P pilus assembly chaperone PapD